MRKRRRGLLKHETTDEVVAFTRLPEAIGSAIETIYFLFSISRKY